MTMDTCRGCGAFLMPEWTICKICGHDPSSAPPVEAVAEAKKGRRRRREKQAKPAKVTAVAGAPTTAKVATPAAVAAGGPPAITAAPPAPSFDADLWDTPLPDTPARTPSIPEPLPVAALLPPPVVAPAPAPVAAAAPVGYDDDDDDEGYDEFEPNRVPMILLVLLIVLLVGYFGIYLPTRDDEHNPLDDVPGQGGATTTSVAVALPEDDPHRITVEL